MLLLYKPTASYKRPLYQHGSVNTDYVDWHFKHHALTAAGVTFIGGWLSPTADASGI